MSKASIINALQSCIDDSNATTGRSDTNVTDCVDRLIRGYGGGGTNIIADVDVEGDASDYLSFGCAEEPDAVIVYAKEWTYTDTIVGVLGVVAVRDHFVNGVKCKDNGDMEGYYPGKMYWNGVYYPWGNSAGNGYISGSYSNGVFTVYSRGVGSNLWSASYTYRCLAIKF